MASIINATTTNGLSTTADNSGSLQLATNNGTTAVTIDTSQNVGIGTASPASSGIPTTIARSYNVSTAPVGAAIALQRLDGSDVLGSIGFYTSNGTKRYAIETNVVVGAGLEFNYGSSNMMYLNTSGALLVGQTVQQSALFEVRRNSGSIAYLYNNAGTGAQLAAGNTAWSAVSDERKKDIIEPIQNAVDKINSLRTVIGKYKVDEETTRRSFLIAQDVQAVFPEAVTIQDDEDKTLLLQYTDLIPLLTAAIQELNAKVEAQAARIAELEGAK